MHRINKKFFSIAVLCLLTAYCSLLTAYAQGTGVKGKVRNMRGDGISGATITARQNGKEIKSAKSGAKGEFTLDGLESGVYNIAVEAKSYAAGVLYNVEVKQGKIRDLGNRLLLAGDKGTQVIIIGSVFYKSGYSAGGAKVELQRVNADGSVKTIAEAYSDIAGEFSFRQPEGSAKFRLKATLQKGSGSKDLDVDSAAIYRLAISLDVNRDEK